MMSSALRSYYLQQMGIETWVRRNPRSPESAVHLIPSVCAESPVLVVFEGGEFNHSRQWIDGAVGRLLKNMLHSIGLSSENTAVLFGAPEQIADVIESHVHHLKPHMIIVLESSSQASVGFQLANRTSAYTSQMMTCAHPLDLLQQPSRKKTAFADLLQIKSTLSRNCSDHFSSPTFRGLSAESRVLTTSLETADQPRDVGMERAVTLSRESIVMS